MLVLRTVVWCVEWTECLSLPTEEHFVVMRQQRQVDGGRWCTRVLSRREHGVLTDTVCTECEFRQVASGARSLPGWRCRGTVGQTRVWRLHWWRANPDEAPLRQRAVGRTAPHVSGAVPARHQCSHQTRVPRPRHPGGDRAPLATCRSSHSVQTASVLVHHALTWKVPAYITDLLLPVAAATSRQTVLRSATTNTLFTPGTRLRFGERAFRVAAPKVPTLSRRN